jgi:hypothetical protein
MHTFLRTWSGIATSTSTDGLAYDDDKMTSQCAASASGRLPSPSGNFRKSKYMVIQDNDLIYSETRDETNASITCTMVTSLVEEIVLRYHY